MHIPVRRIRGINIRVRNLRVALDYYVKRLGLIVDGQFGREAFLQWSLTGEDFVGVFESQRPGWHHLELRLLASSPAEAIEDLRNRGLLPRLSKVGSTFEEPERILSQLTSSVRWVRPLKARPLIAEILDPDGRPVELVYFPEDRTVMETPGLHAIEIRSSCPNDVFSFYERVGFVRRGELLMAVSGQRIIVRPGNLTAPMRIMFAPTSYAQSLESASGEAMSAGGVPDPDGHLWVALGNSG